jgi:hypothetical protein
METRWQVPCGRLAVEDDDDVGGEVRLRLLGRFRVYRGGEEIPAAGRYEARLAAVELAYATGDPRAAATARSALAAARAGGHAQSAVRLAALLGTSPDG